MINKTQAHLLDQMQAMQALAVNKTPAAEINTESQGSFGDLMQQAINRVSDTQNHASGMTKAFELGENVDLAQVMIAVQKSRVSFEALNQVRNKLLGAYQDVMNMSV